MTIYFIRAVDCGRIKIGYTDSRDPTSRLSSMQTGCPSALELLGHCAGDMEREQGLHELFSESRVRGEWFSPSDRLSSLISYAKQLRTTEGWEQHVVGREDWAAMAKHYVAARKEKPRTELEIKVQWSASLRREVDREFAREHSAKRLATPWEALDLHEFWSVERGRLPNPVVNSIQPDDYRATEFGWVVGGARFDDSKAAIQTIELLSKARSPDDIVAVWIGACIHFLTNGRHGNAPRAEESVPGIRGIESACRSRLNGWWPHLGVRALPLSFVLPERCVLSDKEFLHMVARHMRATLSCCVPVATWEHGAGCGISESHEVAA